MNRTSRWVATTCALLMCAVVTVAVFVSMGQAPQGGSMPFAGIANQLASEEGANGSSDVASSDDAVVALNDRSDQANAEDDPDAYETGAVLVTLDEGLSLVEAGAVIAQETGLQDVSVEAVAGSVAKVTFGGNTSVKDAIVAITSTDVVTEAQPNFTYYADADDVSTMGAEAAGVGSAAQVGNLTAPQGLDLLETQATRSNDPLATVWALESVDAYKAWDKVAKSKTKNAVTVAVMDLGFRLTHEDFTGKFVYNAATGKYDKPLFVAPYNSYTDKKGAASINTKDSHGSHVAGIIAAHVNNGKGVAGITNNMVQVMPVQAFDVNGKKTHTDALVRGVRYVISQAKQYNVRVLNMSLGGGAKTNDWGRQDLLFMDAIADAYDAGIVPVVSAGNVNSDDPKSPEAKAPFYHMPGDLSQCVSVINLVNTDESDPKMVNRFKTSNYNRPDEMGKDVSAPGTSIMSAACTGDNKYIEFNGTSMAAPMVSGIMALMFVVDNEKMTPNEATSKLYSTVMPLYSKENKLGDPVWSDEFGYGETSALQAVSDLEYLSGPATLYAGEQGTYKLNLPSGVKASAKDVKWRIYKSVGGTVATCASNGMKATVTGKNEGAFVLYAEVKVGKVLYRALQTVAVYKPEINGPKNVTIGDRQPFYTSSAPAGGNRTWIWSSSNPAVASVSKGGTVAAKSLGTVTLTATLKSNPKVKDTKKITVKPIDFATDDEISVRYNIPTYTGKALKPKMTVIWNEDKPNLKKTLVEGKDYKLTYLQNVNAGKAAGKVRITALKGSKLCTGTGTISFTIKGAPIANAKVTGVANRKYTGKAVAAQNPKVVVGSVKLKAGTNYTLSYLNAKKKAVKPADVKAKGTYYLVITGKGNYAGTVTKPFKVS